MKFISLLNTSFVMLTLASCQSISSNSKNPVDTLTAVVGNDQDSLGCKSSAGYTWSQVKQTCIRPWEDGIQMYILSTSAPLQTAAYVVIDSTKGQAEVFMAEEKNSLVLSRTSAEKFSNGNFNLFKENHCWTLSLNQTKLYQEPSM